MLSSSRERSTHTTHRYRYNNILMIRRHEYINKHIVHIESNKTNIYLCSIYRGLKRRREEERGRKRKNPISKPIDEVTRMKM